MSHLPPGTAPIKAEYLINAPRPQFVDDDAAEALGSIDTRGPSRRELEIGDGKDESLSMKGEENGEPPTKRLRLSGAEKKRRAKEEARKRKGANKGRKFVKTHDEVLICWAMASGEDCGASNGCKYNHDLSSYLASKAPDIYFPPSTSLTDHAPFVQPRPADPPLIPRNPIAASDSNTSSTEGTFDTLTICPAFANTGRCHQGYKCRFFGAHMTRDASGNIKLLRKESQSVVNGDVKVAIGKGEEGAKEGEINWVRSGLLKELRTRKYPTPRSDAVLKVVEEEQGGKAKQSESQQLELVGTQETREPSENIDEHAITDPEVLPDADTVREPSPELDPSEGATATLGPKPDKNPTWTKPVPLRLTEKKRLNWRGGDMTYLAPLTTVGNLPFRRLCVSLGADITCSEMGLAASFLTSSKAEWSLVRRWDGEKNFGVQIAGNKAGILGRTAEVLENEFNSSSENGVDFVDLNCGCPIDMVFNSGSGSALLHTATKLSKIVSSLSSILDSTPLTVKLRSGIKDGQNTAHKYMPRLATEWGASAITLHGRTRQQRYSKLADWDYIKLCVEKVREREEEEGLSPIPIYGGGDCFSSTGYWETVNAAGVDGVMIARGALIKPWIFTEVKEKREWDIRSVERLELIRKYAEYGLSHFGTDTIGVNTTRRFLCEALSFQYRYIPIGLLEVLPGKINDRPPAFKGRDELETLLASPNSQDWVRISEMFLGKAPEEWTFLPKHKSNAYDGVESQG